MPTSTDQYDQEAAEWSRWAIRWMRDEYGKAFGTEDQHALRLLAPSAEVRRRRGANEGLKECDEYEENAFGHRRRRWRPLGDEHARHASRPAARAEEGPGQSLVRRPG
jgi:hypothetical protein